MTEGSKMDNKIKEIYANFKNEMKDQDGILRELQYYICVENVDANILFIVDKVLLFLYLNQETIAAANMESYLLNKLSKFDKTAGERRFRAYKEIMLPTMQEGKLKRLWIGVPFDFMRDFWEVFFLISLDVYTLQQLAMQ